MNPTPPTPSEQEKILARYSADKQRRLVGLYNKWLDPENFSLKDSELKELLRTGMVKDESKKVGAVEIPKECNQSEFAELVTELYGVPVDKMAISRVIAKEGMPGRQKNGGIKTAAALKWWETHKASKGTDGGLFQRAQEAEMNRKIDEAKRARRELELFEQANSDRYLPRDQVEKFILGLARSNSVAFTQGIEKDQHRHFCADLESIPMPDELRLQIREAHLKRCRQTNDDLQRKFGQQGERMIAPEKEQHGQ